MYPPSGVNLTAFFNKIEADLVYQFGVGPHDHLPLVKPADLDFFLLDLPVKSKQDVGTQYRLTSTLCS
jgi:hypothetical protein